MTTMRLPTPRVCVGKGGGGGGVDGEGLSCYYYPLRRRGGVHGAEYGEKKISRAHPADIPHSLGSTVIDSAQCLKPHVSVSHVKCQKGWRHGEENRRRLR